MAVIGAAFGLGIIFGPAIGAGLVWGYLRKRFERLGPSLFAHAFFTWAIVEFPLWHL